jgi:superfamily II DNA or RNA helicase
MTFAVGSLVKARGREWVVLPDSADDLLVVRPLGGSDAEITGLYLPLESVSEAHFALPDARDLGDHRSARLLHEALRLGIRSSAGPFRSFGRIAVDPRPYQLVPLLMALRLDPVRLLIADDVGIGKTIEALLVARELLDRGAAQRLAVLCPPHLAGQWQAEMRDKFHLDAELVLASTAARLERGLRLDESLFDRHPITIVSTDFIKSDRRRDEFLRAAPELVVVDEAHGCTDSAARRGGRHQRYQLVRQLSDDLTRNLVLVTATPHSGNEAAFRELVGFLDRSFRELPDDLSTTERRTERQRLARQFVQRRRGDIQRYLGSDTPFPDRLAREETYALTPEYRRLFERVLSYARETVRDTTGGVQRQRVRWWSALGLLRALGSSPAAAAMTLRSRAQSADAETVAEADEIGRRNVLDLIDDESAEGADVVPGADAEPGETEAGASRRRLRDLAREADTLFGRGDAKLARGIEIVRGLVRDGSNPIIFCRFIATAEYLKNALRTALGADVTVEAITGELAGDVREARVRELMERDRRVLVATDCLSEGINLQEGFDAVVHYDLSWNPTRHEQREGRVDRYLQPKAEVKVVTLYGLNNQIDGIVLAVLLRKHRTIRDSLGISVPVPIDSNAVLEAILEGLLLRGGSDASTVDQLELFERDVLRPQEALLHEEWDRAVEREQRSRTVFAQETIDYREVEREVIAAREAVGSGVDVERFVREALVRHGATVRRTNGVIDVDLGDLTSRALRDVAGLGDHRSLRVRFDGPPKVGEILLGRTHPIVEGLAAYLTDTALDREVAGVAKRAGVIRTGSVAARTTALLVRLRYDLSSSRGGERQLAEEIRLVAFSGTYEAPAWLDDAQAAALVAAEPSSEVAHEHRVRELERFNSGFASLSPHVEALAATRAAELRDAHDRVRAGARIGGRTTVDPQLPVDILGAYVYLPTIPA